jgi:hypothetical protein
MKSLSRLKETDMNTLSRWLATVGALIAGPSFVLNVVAHNGVMPGPDEVDRTDGAFSLMFMAGAALVVAALILVRPSPLGRKGRWLLVPEAAMVVLGGIWAAAIVIDPANVDSNNPLIVAGDASWPLHQVFMLVIGIAAVRADLWDSPTKFTLFGPVAGILGLGLGFAAGFDHLAAGSIGAGWMIVAIGIVCVSSTSCEVLENTPLKALPAS